MSYNASYARLYQSACQIEEAGTGTWLTRGANFLVAVTRVKAGTRLVRIDNPDEYIAFLPDTGAKIEANGSTIDAGVETVTIVPPGASSVIATGDGQIVRIFSSQARDLLDLAGNATIYANGAPGVAPPGSWPAPADGFKLRHYRVADFDKPDSNMRIFRSANLMINVLKKRTEPRDIKKLSPHTHADFEQASLALQGTYVHHLRWPWTPDMTAWQDDRHEEMASPSVLVVPPKVVHTSRNINSAGWLVDVFSPPRLDFCAKPGMVCNANEYPLPPGIDLSAYASGNAA